MNANNWKAVLLLSIVIPVGLLATFKLTGLLQNPATIAEIITLESVEWEFERPYEYTVFDKILRVPYSSDCFSGTFDFVVIDYIENTTVIVSDRITMMIDIDLSCINLNASIEKVYVSFYEDYKQSNIYWYRTDLDFVNLSVFKLEEEINEKNDLKTLINLVGLNHPSNAHFSGVATWCLSSLNTQGHELRAVYEITYYNGTVYNKIVQPFKLLIKED